MLYQNLFWFFGHPEVYILALPYFGIVTDVIPVFSKKPLFGYKGMVFATMAIAALSTGVWAHHMFTTGVVLLPFFSLLSLLIAVPTGIKFFNWIGTMWRGQLHVHHAHAVLHRVPLRLPDGRPHRRHAGVAAHRLRHPRHLLRGGPLPPGALRHRRLRRVRRALLLVSRSSSAGCTASGLGKWHFWLLTIGFWVTFMPQYVLGLWGMPRRVASYPANLGWQTLNVVSTDRRLRHRRLVRLPARQPVGVVAQARPRR